jgi:2TM domain
MADEPDEQYLVAKRRVEAKKGFYVHAFFFVVLNAIFLVAIGWDFLWATVFWGLGLVLHGASVFFSASDWVKRWEHRAIEKELGRQAGNSTSSGAPPPPPPPPPPTSPPTADATQPGTTPQRANAAKPT